MSNRSAALKAAERLGSVSAAIYFGATRGEKRRIKAKLRKLKNDALTPAQVAKLQRTILPLGFPVAAELPLALLACSDCGRPTPQCTCLDADGKPLDWGLRTLS